MVGLSGFQQALLFPSSVPVLGGLCFKTSDMFSGLELTGLSNTLAFLA